jgi:hypothetical protein
MSPGTGIKKITRLYGPFFGSTKEYQKNAPISFSMYVFLPVCLHAAKSLDEFS